MSPSNPGPHTIYLGAAARPPKGGWAWRRVDLDGARTEGSGGEPEGSVYRLRLLAASDAIHQAPPGVPLDIHTGDPTLVQLASQWMHRWEQDGWKKKSGAIQDLDAVRRLAAVCKGRELSWSAGNTEGTGLKEVGANARAAAEACDPAGARWMPTVELPDDVELVGWTDGGCRKNPGPGGWGFVLIHVKSGVTLLKRGGEANTTNNRMELSALLELLATISRPGVAVEVRADSKYVIQTATEWMPNWKRKGWTRGKNERGEVQEVANLDLVKALDEAIIRHKVRFVWTKGHSGDPGNELADSLCNHAMDDVQRGAEPASSERRESTPFPVSVRPAQTKGRSG